MRHAPECAHLQFFDLVGAVNFTFQTDFLTHFLRSVRQNGRSHAVRRLVHQIAREILRFPDYLRLLGGFFERGMIAVAAGEDGKRINLLIFPVAAVVVGVEVANQRALDNRSHGFLGRNAGRGDEGEAADSARLERTYGSPGDAAQIVTGELFRRAAADQQQALGFQSGRLVQQIDFKRLSSHFAVHQQVGRSGLDSGVAGRELELRFFFLCRVVVILFGVIQDDGDERFGFELSGRRESDCRFHDVV